MKVHTTHKRLRHVGIKVDDVRPKGWKDGDPVPQIRHAADFDESGNATVDDATGRALMKAYGNHIKEGHAKAVSPPAEE